MKRRYFFIFSLVVFSLGFLLMTNTSHAQRQSKWYIGAMVGPTMTNITGDFPGNNFKTGFSGGGTVGRSFGDNGNFKVQADILFSLKGFDQKFTEKSVIEQESVTSKTTTQFDNTLNLGYLEVPLTARYSIPLGSGTFPYESRQGTTNLTFFAGPYFGYLFGAGAQFDTKRTNVVQFKDAEGEVTNESENTGSLNGGKFRVSGRGTFGTNPIANQLEEIAQAGPGLDKIVEDFKETYPSTYSGGISNIDIGFTAGVGLSFKISDQNQFGVEGRIAQGMVTIDDSPGAFNTISVKGSSKEGQPFDITSEQATLQNIQYAGYVTWTYRFDNSTF